MSSLICIVGLGNPGSEYSWHRHNVGFMAVDEIAAYYKFPPWKSSPKASQTQGSVEGTKVLLVKPMAYMNRSGAVLSEILRFFKIDLSHVMVIHDDLDLDLGRLKAKQGGGNAGHNGLRDIDNHCGVPYWRLRFGIGHPGVKERVHGHVLGNFTTSERDVIGSKLDQICFALPLWFQGNYETFMNRLTQEA